jgi:pyruvate-ferredoxin/flavodoxin oxidoreductase
MMYGMTKGHQDNMSDKPRYPGIRVTTNGNQLVAYHTEARITDGGVFYPITPSTEMGENYQLSFAEGHLNVFGKSKLAIEAEGEHAAQGGAIAMSVTGKRVVNFTSGQGLVYGLEQYYHAPGKLSTMVVEIAARALTKHALNVHCGHDDIYTALDTGWIMLFGKDSQQAADQALILRKVCEKALNPGMNIQDGFLTSHLERTFYKHEAELIREFLGAPDDIIDCPTESQKTLFGPTRRRVPSLIDLTNPILLGPVQNQEHYMQGVVARRNNFSEPILGFLQQAYDEFTELTGRHYGLISEYRTDDAETVFVSLGSAAENIEAAVDYLREKGESVGSIHLNVIRPFPEAAVVKALTGKRQVIVMERTDEPLAGSNPMTRNIQSAFLKAVQNARKKAHKHLPAVPLESLPRLFTGVYGLGSRDFRPEGILGAYEYVTGSIARTDGRKAVDGESFIIVGVDHPYSVKSKDTPSLLPENAIAVRLHSIGGWGMITTGKNLGEIIGELGNEVSKRNEKYDEFGRLEEAVHVSANPKYGSEKKGAPTSYFLVGAPERVRVNCDLHHVNVVLCCDPKVFLHTNPLEGLVAGGAFVWESQEAPEKAWERIPAQHRQFIIDNKIRVYLLPGFDIARNATDRPELQLRMQGNAFLGAFFSVSTFLKDNEIDKDQFTEIVHKQYVKKFSRFGDAVIDSNMEVMRQGFDRVNKVDYGALDAPDSSSMRGHILMPLPNGCGNYYDAPVDAPEVEKSPMFKMETFDKEFRAGLGYDQPSSTLSSVGLVASATGATASKYVARREKPIFIAENCTQCMKCIAVCPDTALPNTAQTVSTVLRSAIQNYVSDDGSRDTLLNMLPDIDTAVREKMLETVKEKGDTRFGDILRAQVQESDGLAVEAKDELLTVVDQLPIAYNKVNAIFGSKERKNAGDGGVFMIFVSDLCKGCGECVEECGDHDALRMESETDTLNALQMGQIGFLDTLPDTPRQYLGLYNDETPQDSKEATLRNHLMVRRNYEALVSGDGACAGCGEKSVLRSVATITEAYMRPIFHTKAERLSQKAAQLEESGAAKLKALAKQDQTAYVLFKQAVAHTVMGLGGENDEDTKGRINHNNALKDADVISAMVAILRQDAFNHKECRTIDGRLSNGMSVMAMGANTGCNSVYGSTPPNNPHPYPWMNSLFQDGATVAWLFGESFIMDHARRSIIPERLTDALLERTEQVVSEEEYFTLTHFTDSLMTDREISELPKAWGVGGDGGMGDIGYQNVSKVVLQNRPNVMILLLDTQVYSNTGGQNSDSSIMPGGFDMNQIGAATQGKMVEKKSVSESFTSGHGSPFVAQVSMANAPKMYKALLDGLEYRGTAFYQCFTTCQPEHGVADDMSTVQAQRIRDSRGMPEFVFNPDGGETYGDALELKGNPSLKTDWWKTKSKATGEQYLYTTAHWGATEARFRRHLKRVKDTDVKDLTHLDDMLVRITQADVVQRRFLDPDHRSYVPDFGVYIETDTNGKAAFMTLSRQLVLFCVERRKAWRMLQSKAGIENLEYKAQMSLLKKVDAGDVEPAEFLSHSAEMLAAELEG